MDRFVLSFTTNNAAFADGDGPEECARILRRIADKVSGGDESGMIVDSNGNSIGQWSVDFPAVGDEE